MRRRLVHQRRVWRRARALAWVARADDPRTNGLVRDELQAIYDRHDVGIS